MASQAVVEKTPLWFILFCFSSGLLIALSFPFDIFALNVQNGIVLASTTLPTAIKQFDQNFTPFIMVKHLGDLPFPSGLVEIILLGLVIGTLVYLFNTVYENINHVVANIIRKTPLAPALRRLRTIFGSKDRPHANKEIALELTQIPRFIKWLQNTNTAGYADFIFSMVKLTEGLLFGAETFFLLNIIRILSVGIQYINKTPVGLSHSIESMAWFALSLILGLVFYYSYKINQEKAKKSQRVWVEDFKKVDC